MWDAYPNSQVNNMATAADTPTIPPLEYRITVGLSAMEGRGFYYPVDTLPTSHGRMYVVNRSVDGVDRGVRVTMCDLDSNFYGTFASAGKGDGQFVYASGIAEDGQGRIYITDEYENRVTVFDLDGKFLTNWGKTGGAEGELDGPSGIAVGADDTVYVADTHNHRVQRFTPSGISLGVIGEPGDGEGQLDLPWGIAIAPQWRRHIRSRLGQRPRSALHARRRVRFHLRIDRQGRRTATPTFRRRR